MMPQPGKYDLWKITKADFIERTKEAHKSNTLVSYIGYLQNAKLIHEWTGVRVAINRDRTEIQDGDTMLCMTLRYRADNYKGQPVGENDFDFFACSYKRL